LLCLDVNKYLYILLLCHVTGWLPLSCHAVGCPSVQRGRIANLTVQSSA